MIDVHYASLTSQGVQHRVFYLDGHPSRYQPRPTGRNFGEQTGTGVFPLVIAVPQKLTLKFQFDLMQDLPENHLRVSGASWVNIINYYYDDDDNLPSAINGKYSDTDNNDEANNDDDTDSKKDNSKDEYKENMATRNISLGKALYLVP